MDYIPCACYSLNVVGQSAVNCCVEAVSYFGFLHQLHNFFQVSTHQWEVLLCYVKQEPVVLFLNTHPIPHEHQTGYTRNQANTLAKQIDTKEVAFMCELCNDILQRFNKCSILLQSLALNLPPLLILQKAWINFLLNVEESLTLMM